MRLNRLSILAVVLISIVITGCGTTPESRLDVNRIVYGLTLSPSGFDPHIHQSSEIGIVLRQVYDTLVYRDPDTGAFVSGLAESWSVSTDQTVYTFVLKQGVKFHDGTSFDAAAVGANLNRITAPETRSQNALALLGPYSGFEIIDDFTIAIRLSEPFSPFLDSLSQFYLGIASPTALSAYSVERYQFNQVGTGPYADAIAAVFSSTARRVGLWRSQSGTERAHDGSRHADQASTFRRPQRVSPQLRLL